jgi:hypothetical protein
MAGAARRQNVNGGSRLLCHGTQAPDHLHPGAASRDEPSRTDTKQVAGTGSLVSCRQLQLTGEIEEACGVAGEAFDVGIQLQSDRVLKRVARIRRELDPWKDMKVVRELEAGWWEGFWATRDGGDCPRVRAVFTLLKGSRPGADASDWSTASRRCLVQQSFDACEPQEEDRQTAVQGPSSSHAVGPALGRGDGGSRAGGWPGPSGDP